MAAAGAELAAMAWWRGIGGLPRSALAWARDWAFQRGAIHTTIRAKPALATHALAAARVKL